MGSLDGSSWVPIREEHLYSPFRKVKVICVGAGFAGLMLAYLVKYDTRYKDVVDLTIYEKNADVGGTWFENKYPGVACDVPAQIYTFPFEPNPDWSSFYASGPEIFQYIKRTVKKYDLDYCVKLNSGVIESVWDNVSSTWKIKVQLAGGKTIDDEGDVLINASGFLNRWKWPKIEGFSSFKGKTLHTARWDTSYDWTRKRVAVVGNGSSAIQVIPKIQPDALRVINYIRAPTWISVNYCASLTPEGKNFRYTEEELQMWRDDPVEFLSMRKTIEHSMNCFFYNLFKDSDGNIELYKASAEIMKRRMQQNKNMISEFIPAWEIGCRRLSPGDGYLEALQMPNSGYTFSPISRITDTGILTEDGILEEFDLIVMATGFDVSFVPSWRIRGPNNSSLESSWEEDPQAYFGLCAAELPNYFIFNGPNSPVGHGNLLQVMWWSAEYMMKWCCKLATEDISSFSVKNDVVKEYNIYSQEYLKRTVWSGGCRSWYKNGKVEGKVTAMYAGSALHFKDIVDNIRGEDFDITYRSVNRFRFMGNGLTELETNKGDLSFYVK